MTKEEVFRIGMNIHKIVMLVDNSTLKLITPYLSEIESIVLKEIESIVLKKEEENNGNKEE